MSKTHTVSLVVVGISGIVLALMVVAKRALWAAADVVETSIVPERETPGGDRAVDRSTSRRNLPDAEASIESGSPTSGSLVVHVAWAIGRVPAPDVNVTVFQDLPGTYHCLEAVTGGDGAARFPSVTSGNVSVSVDRGVTSTVVVKPRQEAELTIEMDSGIEAVGLVVDGSGTSVGGAEIWLSQGATGEGQVIARADERGRFAVRGLRRAQLVGARAPGYCPSLLERVTPAAGAHIEWRFRLSCG